MQLSRTLKRTFKKEKYIMYEKTSQFYNEFLETYFDEYSKFPAAKTKKTGSKYKPKEFFLENYNHDDWYKGYTKSKKNC